MIREVRANNSHKTFSSCFGCIVAQNAHLNSVWSTVSTTTVSAGRIWQQHTDLSKWTLISIDRYAFANAETCFTVIWPLIKITWHSIRNNWNFLNTVLSAKSNLGSNPLQWCQIKLFTLMRFLREVLQQLQTLTAVNCVASTLLWDVYYKVH